MDSMNCLHEHLVCEEDMLDGYMNMYPSYNTFQRCNGICTQFVAESEEKYNRLCRELVPILIKYYAPFSIISPLRKSSNNRLSITIYEGDWDIELFYGELEHRYIRRTDEGKLEINQDSYRMVYVTYTNYDIVTNVNEGGI